jgi:hypothetical protein
MVVEKKLNKRLETEKRKKLPKKATALKEEQHKQVVTEAVVAATTLTMTMLLNLNNASY